MSELPESVWQTMLDWLDAEERARLDRLRFADDRLLFLQAHAFLRCVLAAYGGVAPGDCRFDREPGGRPTLVAPTLGAVDFSLTHTTDLVACLVSGAGVCGVDAEALDEARSIDALAAEVLTDAERASLAAVLPGERRGRFFELWTLKEAYLKARGLGLQVPLSWISLDVGPEPAAIVELHPDLADDPSEWQVRLVPVASAHRVAVAVRSRGPVEVVRVTAPPPGWPVQVV